MEVAVRSNLTSAKAQEDYLLVQKATQGDQKAYALLMNKYRQSIYHTMYKMVSNREDADDLTLEAFGKAFVKLPSYTPRYAFSTWLFKIAINNAIDYIRKKRLITLSIDEPIEHDSDQDYAGCLHCNDLNPEEVVIRNQRQHLLRRLLTHLSDKYRHMIELRYFEELSYEEISVELNIPLGTVKAQLYRAKEMLYVLLQKPGASAYLDRTQRRAKAS
ncbi:MAG: sigma-70 family RNA polymerase sigma factor [Bacteroidota bacterium]